MTSVAAPNVAAPQMTSVSPLLDEQADINRLDMSMQPSGRQNIRVYVVDQDIRDANRKAEVVDGNITF